MNRIKRSRPHDTSQELNSFSPDRIKEQRCPVDRLQTLHSNSYSTMDNSGRLLKLNPFLILDTDPSLDSLKFSSALPRTLRPIGKTYKCVFYNLIIYAIKKKISLVYLYK